MKSLIYVPLTDSLLEYASKSNHDQCVGRATTYFQLFCTILEDTADCEKVSSLIPSEGGLLQDINFSSEINYKCIRQPHKNDLKSKKNIFKDFCMQAIWNCQNQGFALYISLAICNCHNVFI